MDQGDTLIPIFGIVFLFGGPIAAFIVWRVLAHQERMEMLRRGIMPPPDPRMMKQAMKYGWQAGPIPPPGAPGAMPPNYGYQSYPYYGYSAQMQLRRGIQVACIGFAILIGLSFIGYHGDGPPHYGPWLLGGLIPMFVGIAQIISALLSGARFGPVDAGAAFGPATGAGAGTQQAQPSQPTGTPSSGPYAWRPGSTPEIEKPAQPPDYR
ncbi:MAG TPA: hypothetical protein VMH02_02135 [Verrucomicrobiae bacterium]|nr:hypothetical protein [Verrucomicrobiae bacterium]